jgi:serine/alanine adding enzyme
MSITPIGHDSGATGGFGNIRVVRSLDESSWRRFVDANPRSNVFHIPEMFQVFSRAEGHHPELWAAIDGDRVLSLFLPVRLTIGSRALAFLTTRAVCYGSVLYDESPAGIAGLGAVLRSYVQATGRKPLFTELRNLSDLTDVRDILEGCGFVHEDHLNYLVPLDAPLDEIFSRIGRRTRKQIRNGLRRGQVVIREATDGRDVATCYQLLRRTYAAARVPLAHPSLFEAAFELLSPLGMVTFPMAWIDGTCVAASVELVHGDTVYGWYGAVDRRYTSYTPNELLAWYVLRWAAEQGYRTYDFGGAGRPDEEYGVRRFKAKFGGTLVNFGRDVRRHAPWRLAVSRAGYSVYQRFMNGGTRRWAARDGAAVPETSPSPELGFPTGGSESNV